MQQAEAVTVGLNQLAEKLAIPAAHLWDVLTRQAYVNAGTSVVWSLFVALLVFLWVKSAQWIFKKYDNDYDGPEIPVAIGSLVLLILVIVTTSNLIVSIGHLFNPEYFAAQEILDAVKGQ